MQLKEKWLSGVFVYLCVCVNRPFIQLPGQTHRAKHAEWHVDTTTHILTSTTWKIPPTGLCFILYRLSFSAPDDKVLVFRLSSVYGCDNFGLKLQLQNQDTPKRKKTWKMLRMISPEATITTFSYPIIPAYFQAVPPIIWHFDHL